MSEHEKFLHLSRVRTHRNDDSTVSCYMSMRYRVTMQELIDYLAEHYPTVDPLHDVHLNFSTARWEAPSTEEERAQWAASKAQQDERHERWERETYERLKAKFEGEV